MVQLYQFPTRRRAKGSLWSSDSKPTPLRRGLAIGSDHTFPDIGSCIRPHGWPVVALGMGLVRQSSAAWMVSAYSFVEFHQCILPLLGKEAFKIRVAFLEIVCITTRSQGKIEPLEPESCGL